MAMDSAVEVVLSVTSEESANQRATELRDLWEYLTDRPELRGRVTRHTTDESETGRLGPLTDALIAALEPGGAFTVLAGAVVAWIKFRPRTESVKLNVRRPDGSCVEIELKRQQAKEYDAVDKMVKAALQP
ncbi:effector-associated constant component EACC1, partial [Streptomyces sp. Agncl-13]|uniref:effector-associated constant component EACC1 n=1 Tax=Streptomyces sp. Agncl-13 TaxID=3400628 RepID=UPI003A8BE15D